MTGRTLTLGAGDEAQRRPEEPGHSELPVWRRGDHVELAERFLGVLRARGPIVFDEHRLYVYARARGIYEPLDPAEASRIIQAFAGGKLQDDDRRVLRVNRADVVGAAALAHDAVAEPGFFGSARPGTAFQNGFVEASESGIRILEHAPEHRARASYEFDYIPGAKPAAFLAFLGDVFRGDGDASEKTNLIQEYAGACLGGFATMFQAALVLFGDGANGKSVLTKALEASMPVASVVSIPPQDWGNEYRAAFLSGKRLNVVSELPEANILDSESFKGIVAGDSTTARHIREAPFVLRPIAGHIFAANKLPGAIDMTHGFWRRFALVNFPRRFEEHEQDRGLLGKLKAELPAIVSWLLQGGQRALERGRLVMPTSHVGAHAEWKKNADPTARFLEECTTTDNSAGTTGGVLYRRYRSWAADNGNRPMASNNFGSNVARLLGRPEHREAGNTYPVRLMSPKD